VLMGNEPGAEVTEVCRRVGLSPKQYYPWKSQLLCIAVAVFGGSKPNASNQHREAAMEAKLSRLKSVIAEITAENLELKKTLLD
ncbi:MAG: transposase, partial [Planctomycetota bacterium]